ncbi:MAG: hypothetical protein ACLP7P_17290 [Rhodomicrobium sp.]
MEKAHSSQPQTAPHEIEAPLRLIAQNVEFLRHAFHDSASRRGDALAWYRLEHAIAAQLEQDRREALRQPAPSKLPLRYTKADEALQLAFDRLLHSAAPASGRARRYRRAVRHVNCSAAGWGFVLDECAAAYFKHAVLLWTSLWHASDTPAVTVALIEKCAELGPLPAAAPDFPSEAAPKKMTNERMPEAMAAFRAALRIANEAR